jgi:hypothetical protein
MILPANGKHALAAIGFLVSLRKREGSTTNHPKPNLASEQITEPLNG